jgi:nicotinate-nucleotide adenylyltransferase
MPPSNSPEPSQIDQITMSYQLKLPLEPATSPSMPKLRRLCFGGTFNPIHHGHLLCSRAAAEACGFDRVTLIPSAEPPHKPKSTAGTEVAPIEHRLAMCQLAVEGDPLFEINDIERRRSGPSYTIDTIRNLKQEGWPDISWLIGGDTVPQLPTWHEISALLAEVTFIVMDRAGSGLDWSLLAEPYQVLRSQSVVLPLIEISATEIRHRIQDGRSMRYLTPTAVAKYIADHGLYRRPRDPRS